MSFHAPPTSPSAKSLESAYCHAKSHRAELAASTHCGCYFCFNKFAFTTIARWTDADQTALCPRCGIDAVLGDASGFPIEERFLRRMHTQWFTMTGKR